MRQIPILALALAACSGQPDEVQWGNNADFADRDNDGLTDKEEAAMGTDPQLADTDGDGYDDRTEHFGNTDPLDFEDHPYAGGWPIDACRHDVVATGYGRGDIIENVTFLDQYGEAVEIHDFCNHVLLIDHAGFS